MVYISAITNFKYGFFEHMIFLKCSTRPREISHHLDIWLDISHLKEGCISVHQECQIIERADKLDI